MGRRYTVNVFANTQEQKHEATLGVVADSRAHALALVKEHAVMGQAEALVADVRPERYATILERAFGGSGLGAVKLSVYAGEETADAVGTVEQYGGWHSAAWEARYAVERRGTAAGQYVDGQEVADIRLEQRGEGEDAGRELFATVMKATSEDEGFEGEEDEDEEDTYGGIAVEDEAGEDWARQVLEEMTGLAADGWHVQMEGDDFTEYTDAVTLVWTVYGWGDEGEDGDADNRAADVWMREHGTRDWI